MIELLLVAERMLAAGDLDHAERLFTQVAEADPRNAIAVVGLARVAVERGDQAGAIGLARQALEIDPEEAAALGLLAFQGQLSAGEALPAAATGTDPSTDADGSSARIAPAAPERPAAPVTTRSRWRRFFARLRGR